ncbi:glycosyltransferase family 39 protein [Allorhizobium sp. BGMRC 0089]|uniref:glycosyltransferase family 39 protein n=1 Tax=Allorhizobium sonneratiae TaxID=2934936 RepID=UPI002033D8F7|nr:glycosyltransferase family 39 protein [Allorhizobium sonneratiae]MCM2291958.1 glycosyltransferase family 39 protein [Allorhizobium sonneratiae]
MPPLSARPAASHLHFGKSVLKPALLLLAGYFLLELLVRLALPSSLELDEGQQMFFSQALALGYGDQPPLYNWLQYGVIKLFGPTVFSLALLKNLMMFATFSLMALTASRLLTSRALIMIATFGIITMPQISFETARDLTHTVGLLFFTALLLFSLVTCLQTQKRSAFLLLGLAIGGGMLTKYNFALALLPALAAVALDTDLRPRLYNRRFLGALALAVLMMAPHLIWLLNHISEATDGPIDKLTDDDLGYVTAVFIGLFALLKGALANIGLTCLLLLIPFGRIAPRAFRADNGWSRLFYRMMLLTLLLFAIIIAFGGFSVVRERWLAHTFIAFPLLLCLKVEASGLADERQWRQFLPVVLVIMVLIPAVIAERVVTMSYVSNPDKKNVPYAPAINRILAQAGRPPALILASDDQLAGNIHLVRPDLPVLTPKSALLTPPDHFSADKPLLVIWRDDGKSNPLMLKAMKDWLRHYPGLSALSTGEIALPYFYSHGKALYSFSFGLYTQPAEQVTD